MIPQQRDACRLQGDVGEHAVGWAWRRPWWIELGRHDRAHDVGVAAGGSEIELELWRLDVAAFGALVAGVPGPLTIGDLRLADGSTAKGYLAEAQGVEGAADISGFGGWRAYRAADAARRA